MEINQKYHLIFIHQPKCGGSTLKGVFKRNLKSNQIFEFNKPYKQQIEEFKAQQPDNINHIRLLQGHFGYGLHKYLPYTSYYVSILRDPIERVTSHYNYGANKSDRPAYMVDQWGKLSISKLIFGLIPSDLTMVRFVYYHLKMVSYSIMDTILANVIEKCLKKQKLNKGFFYLDCLKSLTNL
jgi:hypothetical protein